MRASLGGVSVLALAASPTVFLRQLSICDAFAYVDQPHGSVPAVANPKNANVKSPADVPDPKQLQEHAEFASFLADAARKEILPYWRQSRRALGQQTKVEEDRSVFQSASPVTLADRAAERAMRELITNRFPDHGIYGEEYGIKSEWNSCVAMTSRLS